MAALDTPWLAFMAPTTKFNDVGSPTAFIDATPPTFAGFSPVERGTVRPHDRTVFVQEKSALLTATPPQITRALAFSHPFVLPLNKLVGLISWSSGDPWESFLLVALFWAVTLVGADIIQWTGPMVAVASLVAGLYSRRYSPLSTKSITGESVRGHKREPSRGSVRHQKSLDDIVETLNTFTMRCNILISPLVQLTDFLSTQQSATSATTRPALTTLFVRILMILPIWITLTLPPFQLITTQRVVLVAGTMFLTWHSRPARISRTILWRSNFVRYAVATLTGFSFEVLGPHGTVQFPFRSQNHQAASALANGTRESVRFTFTVHENQRRWLGLGWTSQMFAYERAPWTDEHLNPSPPKERFQLPPVEGGNARWRWVPGSEWRTEGQSGKTTGTGKNKGDGWIYYDNKWSDGRRQDGWGRYTRRRKWYRDAELVEIPLKTPNGPEKENAEAPRPQTAPSAPTELPATEVRTPPKSSHGHKDFPSPENMGATTALPIPDDDDRATGERRRRGLFKKKSGVLRREKKEKKAEEEEDDRAERRSMLDEDRGGDWMMGDDLKMNLG